MIANLSIHVEVQYETQQRPDNCRNDGLLDGHGRKYLCDIPGEGLRV